MEIANTMTRLDAARKRCQVLYRQFSIVPEPNYVLEPIHRFSVGRIVSFPSLEDFNNRDWVLPHTSPSVTWWIFQVMCAMQFAYVKSFWRREDSYVPFALGVKSRVLMSRFLWSLSGFIDVWKVRARWLPKYALPMSPQVDEIHRTLTRSLYTAVQLYIFRLGNVRGALEDALYLFKDQVKDLLYREPDASTIIILGGAPEARRAPDEPPLEIQFEAPDYDTPAAWIEQVSMVKDGLQYIAKAQALEDWFASVSPRQARRKPSDFWTAALDITSLTRSMQSLYVEVLCFARATFKACTPTGVYVYCNRIESEELVLIQEYPLITQGDDAWYPDDSWMTYLAPSAMSDPLPEPVEDWTMVEGRGFCYKGTFSKAVGG